MSYEIKYEMSSMTYCRPTEPLLWTEYGYTKPGRYIHWTQFSVICSVA